jgi:hypothetical protein
MKSWGKRRKAEKQALAEADNVSNFDSKAQQQSTSFGKSLRRKKTNAPEIKPELDLTSALPDTNDFRTSLMMPAFSARFSMLREADDPASKIGKASDDSVLFPKRASRLNLFNHNPLTDIAEVDSIRGSTFRPPFADNDRSHSFSDGYASDDGGSIMSRSKPGEGNNLFGGRQKLYRVPAKGDGEASNPALGRHMYESDVSMSMFQQLRLKERMERASEDTCERPNSLQQTDTEDADTVNSPSTGFSKNRGTASSTTSAPSNRRTSTAATSVASESLALPPNNSSSNVNRRISDQHSAVERNGTLHKRLYGANLDQVSPNRKNFREGPENPSRARAPSNAKLAHRISQSKSATNLGEKYARQNQVFATSAFRPASPPPSAGLPSFPPMDLGLRDGVRSGSPSDSRNNMSTPVSEDDDVVTYTKNVQPNDRGKATAMGLFNRPQRQFDEQQFTQRQLQMAEGRNSPAPARENSSRAESRASEAQDQRVSSEARTRFASLRASPESANDRASPSAEWAPPPTTRPRTKSSASVAAAATVKARAEDLIRRQNAELAALEANRFGGDRLTSKIEKAPAASTQSASNGTFLDTFDASDESDADSRTHQPQSRGPEGVHPALRDGSLDFDFGDAVSKKAPSHDNTPNDSDDSLTALPQPPYDPNETLTSNAYGQNGSAATSPFPGLGLAGMISHMRDHSTSSSIYPPPSPAFPPPPSPHFSRGSQVETPRAASIASTTRICNPPESTHSDPWDLDNKFSSQQQEVSHESTPRDPNAQMAKKAQQMLGLATALREKSKAQQILGDDAPNNSEYSQWQEESRSTHQREVSSGTQQERDDFESELAERRRKVKESLKSAVDNGSRPSSPGPSTRRSPSMSGNPFSALKHRPSKASMQNQPADPTTSSSKAMKMLGITGPSPMNQPSPRHPQHNAWQEEEERMLQDFGRRPKQRSPDESFEHPRRSPPRDQSAGRYRDQSTNRSGRSTPYEEERERARQRSATPNSGRTSRNRSDSAASGRSKSRQGRHRDGPEPAMPGSFPITPLGEMRSPMMGEMRSPMMGGPPRRPSEPPIDPRQYGRSGSAMSNRPRNYDRPPALEQRDGGLRRGPSLMTATMPSGQGTRSPRPMLSANESMPSPRDTLDEFGRYSPPDQSMMPRSPNDEAMDSPRRAPLPPGQEEFPRMHPSSPHRSEYNLPRSAQPSPRVPSGNRFENGRTTPTNSGRTTPNAGGRKKSVSKNMISEPTFLSSTSSVPLITLPNGQAVEQDIPGPAPMLPLQNPRRRGNSTTQSIFSNFGGRTQPRDVSSPFPSSIPESPDRMHFQQSAHRPMAMDQKKLRNRLRKSSSEGGNMAAKAARQAMQIDHLASPQVPTFPNRSATNLARDGGMF